MAQGAARPYTVGIADKSPLVRTALTQLLSDDDRFALVAVCCTGEELLSVMARERIDVGVVGWVMPGGNGKYVLDHMRSRGHRGRIVVYTGSEGASVAAQVMARGGAAYVSKSEPTEHLLDTIAAVGAGRMSFPFLDVRKIHDHPLASLTRRELDVLSSLALGKSNKEIALEQGVSANTVKFHVKNLYAKLAVRNRSEAVALYMKS